MHPPDAVRTFLEQEKIHSCSVTCALSGGADSVCLLLCLLKFREKYHLELSAIHIQHNLRGEESLRDERFCADLCRKLDIPLQIIPVDVQAYRKLHGGSEENAARECRYQAFETHARAFVATAHNASDNLETIIFRLARGTGLKGLCGIPPRRGRYLRPLLQSSRKEIEQFLSEQTISFVTDSTNQQDCYTRNFIRHHITPLLSKICPGSPEKSTSMLTDILRQEEDFLELSAQQAYAGHFHQNTLQNLQELHPAVQRRCIAIFLEQNHLPASYYQICQVQKLISCGGTAELVRGNVTAHVSQHILFLEHTVKEIPEIHLLPGENRIFPGFSVTAELIDKKNYEEFEKIHKLFANSALDYDIIKKPAVLHGRKSGLYLKTVGRTHTVSVKKWLQTQPVLERNLLHYLSDENGLLWVQNLGTAARAAVTDATEKMLILHVHRTDTE